MGGLLLSEVGRDMGLYAHQTRLSQKGINEPSSSWMSQRERHRVLGSTFLLLHFGHLTFAASCSVMVSVRSNDLPHSLQRYR